MATPYLGEIRMVGFNFAPQGWAFCDGSLIAIEQFDALFTLFGTTYGGDGQQTFALPDLRGRLPVHMGRSRNGSSYVMGQIGGVETVSLIGGQMAEHVHPLYGLSSAATTATPATGSVPAAATSATEPIYAGAANLVNMSRTGQAGSGQPHENLMPYLCLNFIVAIYGVYPSQN